jgi:outer membrane immunogenic protein
MNRIVIAVAGIATLIVTPLWAADMPVKAPPPTPTPVYSWTGWYAGVNAGASFGRAKTDHNAAPVALLGNPANGAPLAAPPSGGFAGSNTESPSGFIGGGQIGYNRQFSPIWVVGFEADFQGAVEKDSDTLPPHTFLTPFNINGAGTFRGGTVLDYQTKIDWFGTVRGRLGYVWGDGNVMSYLTGGLAYGRVGVDGTSTVNAVFMFTGGNPDTFSAVHAIGHSQVNTGWVVGYGTEGIIDFWGARNWTWRIEGLYMDLGDLDDSDKCNHCFLSGGQVFTHTHFTDWILRAGLNYQFH